ncbi:MAG: hypothetical protein L6V93_01750 [Clostridiales bacterium]|nr:MAG: hypothetical protein L6V93_01750 [Clostridiales bacterium]
MIYENLQCIGGVIILVGYIKQIRDIHAGVSCKGLSLKAYFAVFIGITLMEFNAMNIWLKGYGSSFFITNTVTGITVFYLIMLICVRQDFERKTKYSGKKTLSLFQYTIMTVLFLTPCKVNLNTKEISDIVSTPDVITGTLTSERVIIGGNEFPAEEAESGQNQDSFWY